MQVPWDDLGFPVIELPPSATGSPDAAVRFLAGQLVQARRLRHEHAARVVCQVLQREALGSTGLGWGVAVPHAKSDLVEEVLGVVGRSPAGVAWPGALDEVPVRVVVLLLTPASKPGDSLRALEALRRRLEGEADGPGGA
jgi:mannitol/fructose-specific phosphotransferase system IIA component (Ntr-type)